jgi:NAD+ diphosphatase
MVVTEHGVARPLEKNVRQRAEELTSVEHPDFRGESRSGAQKQFYTWLAGRLAGGDVANKALVFSGNPLVRADGPHGNAGVITASEDDPRGRYLLLRDLEVLVTSEGETRLLWLSRTQISSDGGETILLGFEEGVPHLAISSWSEDSAAAGVTGSPRATYMDARIVAPLLPEAEAAVVAQARSMADWHQRTRFCARCGGGTTSVEGGGRRQCDVCGERHYPRVDPSIIVLVEHDGQALLVGRNGGTEGRRSCVAGFVETGESVEEAVVREVLEETGVAVGDVEYSYSQPWPFPAVLMLGCRARARSTEIRVDGVEIGTAGWYTRMQVRAALEGVSDELVVPPALAIAHHLMRDWALESE